MSRPGAAFETLRFSGLRLDVRACVAHRVRPLRGGTLVYLSLFEDEIDGRFESIVERLQRARTDSLAALGQTATDLELTDSIVLARDDGATAIARGGSCTFPLYAREEGECVHLSTRLPVASGAPLSKAGLASSIAAVCLQGSFEPNASLATPLHGWRRVRRGALTTLRPAAAPTEAMIEHARNDPANETVIIDQIRAAFAEYQRSQYRVLSSVVELSGGFDSTLAAAVRAPGHAMRGASVEFPFYEFRFEAGVQRAVAAELGIPRSVLDGRGLFPYARWEEPPQFDEPSVFVTGIRHAEAVGAFAAEHRATRIYVGHGGDHLFAVDLTTAEAISPRLARGAFTRSAWRAIRGAIAQMRGPRWRSRATGCFVYDARQDVWAKERFAVTIRTPFTNLALFHAGLLWSRWNAANGMRPDKGILVRALPELLPAAVVQRKGKVAYDGVWMRAYAANGDHIGSVIDQAAPVLTHIGVSPAWLLRRVRALAEWRPVSDREVLAGYALAAWLTSWGIDRASAVPWR